MPDRKASPKELEPETSTPLPFETGADKFSGPETSLKGDQTVAWDRALLSPFVPWKKLDAQPSEAEIFQELIAEGTAYLLYQRVKKKGDPKLQSGWLFLKLQQSYYLNLVQNISWSDQFLKDFPIHTNRYPTILLKGISLLNTVYQNPGLRHLGDIDLLIRKQDYPEVRQKLESADYVFSDEMQGLANPGDLNSILCHRKSPSTPQPVLHIHWNLINSVLPVSLTNPRVDLDALWRQSVALPGYPSLRILSPTHQIIYYAYHHFKHSFDRLIRLHDLDKTIRYYQDSIDWSEVLNETHRFNLARTVYYPFHLAKRVLATPIPDPVMDSLRPKKLSLLEHRMVQCLDRGGKPVYGHAIVYLALQNGWHHKLHFLYRCFFPSLRERSPATFLYLARRAVRGLKRSLQLLVSLWPR
ncbi:MAG: nucleotidyltransferase family protein [Candidatus Binatia bacterium]